MARRKEKPGFKRIARTGLAYWMASQLLTPDQYRAIKGHFPDPSIALPQDAAESELKHLCLQHTARLDAWLAQDPAAEPSATRTRYDGTVRSLCRIYQEHALSPFREVKHNTQRTYLKDLRILESTIGLRLVRNVTILDVKRWYIEWRKPAADGGPERIDRAHDAVAMFRTVVYFNAALRNPDCKTLAAELERVKFEKGGAREQEFTFQNATAFIKTALDFERTGRMPAGRALHVAIGTIAQFELLLRQMDIIGEWAPGGIRRRLPAGITSLPVEDEVWAGFFTWEAIAGWRWRMKTSKSKYRSAADFDLTRYTLLLPLLEAVPFAERAGAVVKGSYGLPVRADMYRRWFKEIKLAAGIPLEVWNMDTRAGGATEADEAGAAIEAIQGALTHTKESTTLRYLRRGRSKRIAQVADVRSAKRTSEQGEN